MRRNTYVQPAKKVNHVSIFIFVLLLSTSCTWCVNDVEPELKVNILSNSESGGLNIKSSTLTFDLFEFRSCEGILDGNRDFGLFEVKLGDPRAAHLRPECCALESATGGAVDREAVCVDGDYTGRRVGTCDKTKAEYRHEEQAKETHAERLFMS